MEQPIKYIKKVEIQGLFGRYNIDWNLNKDVNILAGGNGSGKSTLLDCICGLIHIGTIPNSRRGLVEKITLHFDSGARLAYQHIKGKDTLKNLEKKAKQDNFYKNLISEIKENEGKNYHKLKSIGFGGHYHLLNDLEFTLSELKNSIISEIDIVSTFDNSLKQSEAVKKLSDDNVETELDWEIYQLQKQYLDYQLNISKKKDALVDENPDNFKDRFENIKHPQFRFLEIIDELFSETDKKINRNENEISFLLTDKEISAYQLSSGEKQLLIILLKVLIQDNKQTIFFMDEPEISLHIDWQEKLIGYIRELNPNAQLIIATHSPGIIMEGWFDKVFELSDLTVKDRLKS